LAGILENEAASLRRLNCVDDPIGSEGVPSDAAAADPLALTDADVDTGPELKESGIDAVERRIEKIMGDLRDQILLMPVTRKFTSWKRYIHPFYAVLWWESLVLCADRDLH
jgi:hypothetical protein